MRHRLWRKHKRTSHVCVHQFIVVLDRGCEELFIRALTGLVDEEVDAAETLKAELDCGGRDCRISSIPGVSRSLTPVFATARISAFSRSWGAPLQQRARPRPRRPVQWPNPHRS